MPRLQMYPASAHLELPIVAPQNAWLQAFAWIRQNTPVDSLFALDPHYMNYQARIITDSARSPNAAFSPTMKKMAEMAARVPPLAPRWLKEVNAQTGWQNFQPADFQRLEKRLRRDLGNPLASGRLGCESQCSAGNDVPLSAPPASGLPSILRKQPAKKVAPASPPAVAGASRPRFTHHELMPTESPTPTRVPPYALIVIVALAVRLEVIPFLYHDWMDPFVLEHWAFGRIARSIASGHGYGSPFADTGLSALLPPVYSYLLAGIFEIFRHLRPRLQCSRHSR